MRQQRAEGDAEPRPAAGFTGHCWGKLSNGARTARSEMPRFTRQPLQSRAHTKGALPAEKLCSLQSNGSHQIPPKDAAGIRALLED